MNAVLTYCWKEWRSQRGMLLGYTLLGLACLCLVFVLVPREWWLDDGKRALALSWFAVIGGIGVLAFATPSLVRNEFGVKSDQFVRRLPGALLPAFGGKLLFLALVAAALPLVCLLAGEGFLLAIGQPWHDLFSWRHDGEIEFAWPWPAVVMGLAMLAVTWVWGIGAWLPGGRMALGGTLLFTLLVGLCVFAVLRQSPGLENGIAWRDWWWWPLPSGLAVAFASWAFGRRGGGPLRSARLGLATAAFGLAPPSVWLGACAWDYHHPDLQRLAVVTVHGSTPDGSSVLAIGSANAAYYGVPMRIDLRDGSATQLGPAGSYPTPEVRKPYSTWPYGPSRWWRLDRLAPWPSDGVVRELLDLQSGTTTPLAWDATTCTALLPADVECELAATARTASRLRGPGGLAAWFERDEVCIETAAGSVERVRWNGPVPVSVHPFGHGFLAYPSQGHSEFDLVRRQQRSLPNATGSVWFVGGIQLRDPSLAAWRTTSKWTREEKDGTTTNAGIDGCSILGLLDDQRLLCAGPHRRGSRMSLFTYSPRENTRSEPILVPGEVPAAWLAHADSRGFTYALLPRDPAGCVWLRVTDDGRRERFARLHVATLRVALVPEVDVPAACNRRVVTWPDAGSAVIADGVTIFRLDVATGERTQLFPRAESPR